MRDPKPSCGLTGESKQVRHPLGRASKGRVKRTKVTYGTPNHGRPLSGGKYKVTNGG